MLAIRRNKTVMYDIIISNKHCSGDPKNHICIHCVRDFQMSPLQSCSASQWVSPHAKMALHTHSSSVKDIFHAIASKAMIRVCKHLTGNFGPNGST